MASFRRQGPGAGGQGPGSSRRVKWRNEANSWVTAGKSRAAEAAGVEAGETKPIGREWRNEANRSSRRVCQRGCITGGRGPGARGRGPERSARGKFRNEANLCVAAWGTKPIRREWRNEANRGCRMVCQRGCITGGQEPGARGRGPERNARGELRNEANLCVAARKARCEGLAGSEDRGTKPIGRGWRNEANRSCRRVGQQGCITVSSVARGEWGFQVSG